MEKTLKITEEQAKKLYLEASANLKEILELNFGKTTFLKNFQDAVKTYEDACEIIGEKPIDEQHLMDCGLGKSEIAFMKLKTIFKAANKMNNDWKADYSNSSQYKYYPYFVWRSSGFRYNDTYFTFTSTRTGSRLCCGTSDDAEYIGKNLKIYITIIWIMEIMMMEAWDF